MVDSSTDFRSSYEGMSDDELMSVAKDRAYLRKDAVAVLDAELRKRGLHPDLDDTKEYKSAWSDYRRRRNLLIFSILSALPLFLVVATVSVRLLDTLIPASAFAVLWLILFAVAGMNVNKFRCPRCGNLFAATKFYNKSMSVSRCVHCGLPKP